MLHKINTLAIVAGFFFVVSVVSVDTYGEHAIVEIKDLVKDAAEAVWSDGNGNPLPFDETPGFYGGVERGNKLGGVNGSHLSQTGVLLVNETVSAQTIDIDFAPTFGRSNSIVRGSYTLQLPMKKRIQLEVIYDLFLDNEGVRNPGEFYVEVHERNALDQNQWIRTGEFHQLESMKAPRGLERVNRIHDSRFVTHHFVTNLTQWAGREIRLDLIAEIPARAVTKQKARWCSARLVGASFNFAFTKPEVMKKQSLKTHSAKRHESSPQSVKYDYDVFSTTEEITINDVENPEASVSTVFMNNRWLAYFHGKVEGTSDRGTMVFDLEYPPSVSWANMYWWLASTLGSQVLRGEDVETAVPGSSGIATRVIKPSTDTADWRYGYTGLTAAVTAENQVHAFIHTEDWSQNGVNLNDDPDEPDGNRDYWYVRIGYARSDVGNGTGFTWMSDSSVGSPTPVVECFMPEWAYTFPKPPAKPRRSYGAAMPSLIEDQSGDYYYMFYVRFLDVTSVSDAYAISLGHQDATAWVEAITATVGGFWDQICVARAPKNLVVSSNYTSNANPWKKGFRPNNGQGDWEFTMAGRVENGTDETSSYSYPVIRDVRSSPKVHYNDVVINEYMMICRGNEGFYIYTTDDNDLTDWSTGILLLEQEEGTLILDPSLIGTHGNDKFGESLYRLYYSYDTDSSPGGHTLVRRTAVFW